MRKTLIATLAIAGLATLVGTARAGTVEVKFTDSDKFTDIGRSSFDRKSTLEALKAHFESLGKKLPEGQALTIEVTDIDLAGEEKWTRHATDVRVLRGRADWPRVDLRYTLSEGGRTLRQGSETIADMAYLMHASPSTIDQPFGYERRMIDRWFSEKLAAPTAAVR